MQFGLAVRILEAVAKQKQTASHNIKIPANDGLQGANIAFCLHYGDVSGQKPMLGSLG